MLFNPGKITSVRPRTGIQLYTILLSQLSGVSLPRFKGGILAVFSSFSFKQPKIIEKLNFLAKFFSIYFDSLIKYFMSI